MLLSSTTALMQLKTAPNNPNLPTVFWDSFWTEQYKWRPIKYSARVQMSMLFFSQSAWKKHQREDWITNEVLKVRRETAGKASWTSIVVQLSYRDHSESGLGWLAGSKEIHEWFDEL